MNMNESKNNDETLTLTLFTKENPLSKNISDIDKLLDLLDNFGPSFCPEEVFNGRSFVKYTHAEVNQILSKQSLGFKKNLDLRRITFPNVSYFLDFISADETQIKFRLKLVIPLNYLYNGTLEEKHLNTLIEFTRSLSLEICPSFGFCHPSTDLMLETDPIKSKSTSLIDVRYIYWLNIFGSDLLEHLGKERVLNAPVFQREQLKCNGKDIILFRIQNAPLGITSREGRINQAHVMGYILNNDSNLEEILTNLQQISNIIHYKESGWGGEIPDLLKMILENVSDEDKEEVWNKFVHYEPPAPTEWLSTSKMKFSDVNDPEKKIETYKFYAEKLIALLHTYIPEIIQNNPYSLPKIDYYFWRLNYPVRYNEQDKLDELILSIGGYIGDLLVRYLDGSWVPRSNFYESQIIVSDRAWLPFLRAKQYMQTQQSIIDYSLTQFFRAANSTKKKSNEI